MENLILTEAYNGTINIGLFNEVLDFILSTTDKDTIVFKREGLANHLWYSPSTESIQDKYGLKYLGELLERYPERIGGHVQNVRAISLALSFGFEFVTPDMIIGNQMWDFLKLIERLAIDDVYLAAALHICRGHSGLPEELMEKQYENTEELVFILSCFDDFEAGMKHFKSQLIDLLGTKRTISPMHNIGMYKWLIASLNPLLKSMRQKDLALLKALCTLPVKFIDKDEKEHMVLTESGYSRLEIAYLNYAVLISRPLAETKWHNTIIGEKIAIEFCREFINSDITHSENTYDLLRHAIIQNQNLAVMCYGRKKLCEIIADSIILKNTDTFSCMYNLVGNGDNYWPIFAFDIMNPLWDRLASKMGFEKYTRVFEDQILSRTGKRRLKKKHLWRFMRKFEEITGTSYFKLLDEFSYNRAGVYALLVEKGLVHLINEYEYSQDHIEFSGDRMRYIRNYASKIGTKHAFLFMRHLYNKGGIQDIIAFRKDGTGYASNDCLYVAGYSYVRDYSRPKRQQYRRGGYPYTEYEGKSVPTYGSFEFVRPFLSDAEHREILGWVDDFVFTEHIEHYQYFVLGVLKDASIRRLLAEHEVKALFETVNSIAPDLVADEVFQNIFLTEEQKLAAKAVKAEQEEKERKALLDSKINGLEEDFADYRGSLQSLDSFYSSHNWSSETREALVGMITGEMDNILSYKGNMLKGDEIKDLLKLLTSLFSKRAMTWDEIKDCINKIMEVQLSHAGSY